MYTITLTIGASGSGKTSWAEDQSDVVNLNRDDHRFNMFTDGVRDWTKYKFSRSNESAVTRAIKELRDEWVGMSDMIVSDTNLNPKIRDGWKLWAEENNYHYKEVLLK